MQSQKQQNDLYSFSRQTIQYCSNPSNAEEAEVEWFYEELQDLLELTPKKVILFIIGDRNAKVGSQETPGVTGRFGLGVENEAGQRQKKQTRMYDDKVRIYLVRCQRTDSEFRKISKNVTKQYWKRYS